MLQIGDALTGYKTEATDGAIGTVGEFLFDDRTWKIRWLVIDPPNRLTGRLILIHPSAIGPADTVRRILPVALSRKQVEASPIILPSQPVSRRTEYNLCDYFGCDPTWDSGGADGTAQASEPLHYFSERIGRRNSGGLDPLGSRDPHLRGLSAVAGYDVQARDGLIGQIENALLEDRTWGIRALVVDTGNPRPGKRVLISPEMLQAVDWSKQQVFVKFSRRRIASSPAWCLFDPAGSARGAGSVVVADSAGRSTRTVTV